MKGGQTEGERETEREAEGKLGAKEGHALIEAPSKEEIRSPLESLSSPSHLRTRISLRFFLLYVMFILSEFDEFDEFTFFYKQFYKT